MWCRKVHLLLLVGLLLFGCGRDFDRPLNPDESPDVVAALAAAFALYQDADYTGAFGAYQTLVADNPDVTEAWIGLAWSAVHAHLLTEAMQAFEKEPADPEAQLALSGLLLLDTGDVERATELAANAMSRSEPIQSQFEPDLNIDRARVVTVLASLLRGEHKDASKALAQLGVEPSAEDLPSLLTALQSLPLALPLAEE